MKNILFIFLYYFITSNNYNVNAEYVDRRGTVTLKRSCVVLEPEFKDVLLSDCFVDKSELIKDFFYYMTTGSRFLRVNAPKGFGKTVNLKMLKAFLQLENGLISSRETKGCSLFRKHDLKIFKLYKHLVSLHCGKYPVIFITFKKIRGNSFNDVLDAFRDAIRDSFLEHEYLLNSTRLDDKEKYRISLYTDNLLYKNLSQLQLQEGLGYLSEKLYFHLSKKVIVLIDDFDAPVWKFLSPDFQMPDVYKTTYFVQEFMVNLGEDNSYVQGGFINDCLRLSTVLLRSYKHIIKLNFLQNHAFVKYYGVTEVEVVEKIRHFSIPPSKITNIKAYYNGYGSVRVNIFSTWSIMNFLQTEKFAEYWIAPDGLHNLRGIFSHTEVRKLVSQLLYWEPIEIHNLEGVSFRDVMLLRDVTSSTRDFGCAEAERFFLFLCHNGYFNVTHVDRNLLLLNIPNKEIHQQLYNQFAKIALYK